MNPNPWKQARLERVRAEVNRRALEKVVNETQRLIKERDATARLLVQAEDVIRDLTKQTRHADVTRLRVELAIKDDVIRALEDRLEQARAAEAYCEREHSPLVRRQQLVERDTG